MEENQNIEYKESWRDEYLKWICGFANAQGGRLFIGINDDKKVVGVAHSHRLLEDIPNKIVPRNKNIASTFYKAGFIEAWGRGIKKIQESFAKANLPMPTIENRFGGVLVTIQRSPIFGKLYHGEPKNEPQNEPPKL